METLWLVVKIILYLLGFLAIALTILPLFKFSAWWVRIGDFPRLQIVALCLLIAVLFLVFGFPLTVLEIGFLVLLLLCPVYHIFRIFPYLPLYSKQVERAKEPSRENIIRILIYNVLMYNRESEKLLALVKKTDPDIVLLAEVDERWTNEIAVLEKSYPHFVKYPIANTYGIALYSRLELVDPQVKFLVEKDIPSIHTDVKLPSGKVFTLYCLHPLPPVPPENDRSAERDAELLMVGRMVKKDDKPTIVAGDLNDVAWSRTTNLFQKISGLLDPRIGRGLYNSFHAKYPFLRFPLDHVFHSNHFRLVKLKRMPHIGSDHFPIYVALSLESTAEFTQEEPEVNQEDHQEAAETIQEAFEDN